MLTGDRVDAVERRGKYIVVRLASGNTLLVHLRMTGGFRYEPATHERAVLELEGGAASPIVTRGGSGHGCSPKPRTPTGSSPSRTGRSRSSAASPPRSSPTGSRGERAAQGRASSTSGRSPGSGTSTPTRRSGTRGSIRGGPPASSRRRGRGVTRGDPQGAAARHQPRRRDALRPGLRRRRDAEGVRVYGRAGEPCERCGTPIAKIVVGGRGTSFCPKCQTARSQAASSSSSRPSRSRRQSSA